MNDKIKKIQILPMSEEGFENGERDLYSIQFNYLIRELPLVAKGNYYYEKSGISEPENTLILFKFKSEIIGKGFLLGKDIDSYGKYLKFESNSISIFVPALTIEELRKVWSDFKEYGQSKKKLDIQFLDKFQNLITNRDLKNISDEELFQLQVELCPNAIEVLDTPVLKAEKNNSSISYYKRNATISKSAIINSNYTCELNQEHKYFVSKFTGQNYVEAHHLIPYEYQCVFEFSLDVDSNILSLCPVCHKLLHFGRIEQKDRMLYNLWEKRKNRLKMSKIYVSFETLLSYYK